MKKGHKKRKTAPTKMNKVSSRSHLIMTLTVKSKNLKGNVKF